MSKKIELIKGIIDGRPTTNLNIKAKLNSSQEPITNWSKVFDSSDGSGKNLVTNSFELHKYRFPIYDGSDSPHMLEIAFAKKDIFEWVYQLYSLKEESVSDFFIHMRGLVQMA